MAVTVEVAKDPAKIKSKLIGNFTKRQVICFGTAGAIGIPLYLITKGTLGTEASALIMVAVMLPFFFFAMYEKEGLPAEQYFMQVIRMKYLRPGIRTFKSQNRFVLEAERKRMEMEVMALEEKQRKRKRAKSKGKK